MIDLLKFGATKGVSLKKKSILKKKLFKVREMQNSSEVFISNFDYYQRVAHKKLSKVS